MTKERVRFTLRIPVKLYSRLEKESKENGVSLNTEILAILWKHVENKGA